MGMEQEVKTHHHSDVPRCALSSVGEPRPPGTKDFSSQKVTKRLKEKVLCQSLCVGVQHHTFSNGHLHPACWIAAHCTTEVINQGSWRAACFSHRPKSIQRAPATTHSKICTVGSAINVMDLTDRFLSTDRRGAPYAMAKGSRSRLSSGLAGFMGASNTPTGHPPTPHL
jgi:hypothetical protein